MTGKSSSQAAPAVTPGNSNQGVIRVAGRGTEGKGGHRRHAAWLPVHGKVGCVPALLLGMVLTGDPRGRDGGMGRYLGVREAQEGSLVFLCLPSEKPRCQQSGEGPPQPPCGACVAGGTCAGAVNPPTGA